MMFIDGYVISVMIYSLGVIIFRSGVIYSKRETLSKNKKFFEILFLIPPVVAVVAGIALFFLKEVVV